MAEVADVFGFGEEVDASGFGNNDLQFREGGLVDVDVAR
jgi:hypothetical protein